MAAEHLLLRQIPCRRVATRLQWVTELVRRGFRNGGTGQMNINKTGVIEEPAQRPSTESSPAEGFPQRLAQHSAAQGPADAQLRDGLAGQRDIVANRRDDDAAERDVDAGHRDARAERRDDDADERDAERQERDAAAEVRDSDADDRDLDAGKRDVDAGYRDITAGDRDLEGEHRDGLGNSRDTAADERDSSAARRDCAADQRDRAADRRDRDHDISETRSPITATLDRGRELAAADRQLAREDRIAAAIERSGAAADRATALADRVASADSRELSSTERDTALTDRGIALADRVAGANARDLSGVDRGTALADRVAGASARDLSGVDRGTALADRVAGARGRGSSGRDRGATVDDRAASAADRRTAAEFVALELRMAESEARAWRVLQAIPDPVVVAGADGIIELANTHAVDLFGYQPDELVGQPIERLIPAALHEAHRAHRRGYIAAKELRPMTTGPNIVAVRKDGSLVPVEVNLSAITLSSGRAVLATIRDISERKLTEAELRISDERFRVSFDLAPIGMALIDLRAGSIGRFLRVNAKLCAMTGRNEADLLATTTMAITHPDEREKTDVNLRNLASSGAVRWDTEKRYLKETGEDVWVHFAVSVVHDSIGKPSYGVSQVEDISDRKRTEAQLQERFHELATNVEIGFLVRQLDPPEFLYFNPAYLTIFGFDPQGPPPTPAEAMALVTPDDLHRVESILGAAVHGERVEKVWRFSRPDGESRWVSCRVSPITDEDGEIRRVAALFEDITDRRNAEAVLAESQEQFRELANNVDVGFSIRSPGEVNYLYLNAEFQAILGFDPADGWPTVKQVLACHRPVDGAPTVPAESVGEPNGRMSQEWRLVGPDGLVRWVRSNTFPVLDDNGQIRRVVGIIEDITERKAAQDAVIAAQAEAERANAAKTEFLSRMSHELRTPLNAVLGFGQLMEMDELTDEHRDGVRHILRAGEHLLGLIDEVLDIARMETGSIRLSVEPVRVGDVVEQTVGMLAPLAARRRIHISVDRTGLEIHVLADHQRFKQVVVNLLANAVKYNNTGGEVRIESGATTDGRFRLTISDTGIGIAEADIGRLFQPFERLAAEHTDIEGTGLGLALTKRMIIEMGGEIGVESQLGKGSSFWIELPVSSPPEQDASGSRSVVDRQVPASGPLTVLYFEDNLSNVRLIEQIVARRPGVELVVAMQGRIGLDMALTHQPDLILLDLHLPDMSGEEILHRLRASALTATTPIVILSADATPDQPKRLTAAGATWYLTKPINVPRILEMIDEVGAATASTPRRLTTMRLPSFGSASAVPVANHAVNAGDNDGAITATSFIHDMINLLGVILTYCDLLEGDGSASSKFPWLEQQRIAAERAIEMARSLWTPDEA